MISSTKLVTERAEAAVFGTLSSERVARNQRKMRYGTTEPSTIAGSILLADTKKTDAITT